MRSHTIGSRLLLDNSPLVYCGQAVVQVVGDPAQTSQFYTHQPNRLDNRLGINLFLYSFFPTSVHTFFHTILRIFTSVKIVFLHTVHRPNKDCDNVYIHNYLVLGVEEEKS